MKIALVHDYIKDYGGAERVLEALHELYPDAPIYTAFFVKNSEVYRRLQGARIITSWVNSIPFFATRLHSPLRFLAPLIWRSFDFSGYDVVIGSSSWYVTKGFRKGKQTKEICYCHTPPRWLYGYKTSIEWQRYWPVRVYGMIVGHFMRLYDFNAAQKVDYFLANSRETKARIKKFYKRDATVIYPPVSLPASEISHSVGNDKKKRDYYLCVGRIVGSKGLDIAVAAAVKLGIPLKIVGIPAGYYTAYKTLTEKANSNVEFLGYVSDEELVRLYSGAKAFLALAEDEDFGITPVEAMLCGTPVIAYRGGGYVETVREGKTGVFFDAHTSESLTDAILQFEKKTFKEEDCITQAKKFSKKRFLEEVKSLVAKVV